MRRVELAAVSGEVLAICGVPGEGCGEQIVGGAVEVVPAAVIPPGRARVGVPEGVLDVLQCGAQPEGLGGVGVADPQVDVVPFGGERVDAEPGAPLRPDLEL